MIAAAAAALAATAWLLAGLLARPLLGSVAASDPYAPAPLVDHGNDAGAWVTHLTNSGLGPAVVTRVCYQLAVDRDEQPTTYPTGPRLIAALHQRLGAVDDEHYALFNIVPSFPLRAGQRYRLSAFTMPTARRITHLSVTITARGLIPPFRARKVVHLVPPQLPPDPHRRPLPTPAAEPSHQAAPRPGARVARRGMTLLVGRVLTGAVVALLVAGGTSLIVGPGHRHGPPRPLRSGIVDRCGRPVLDANGDPVILQLETKPPLTPPEPTRTGPLPSAPTEVATVTTTLVPADIRPPAEVPPCSDPLGYPLPVPTPRGR
ncbi:MAG TPA: hypothetical protein VFQ85_08270 [Mycobacteriales bacterium]|jgi:hypothetical protein|nr:hypothetical protein [Mycobacteriales bacterium]